MPVGSRQSQTVFSSTPISERQNGSFSLDGVGKAGQVNATTISFTAPNTIADSANNLAGFKSNDIVVVVGSPLNSRNLVVVNSSAGSLTVTPPVISTEAAGANITLIRD